ncbi:hypothetical protein D3C80_1400280 [compost metagenome]
MARVSQHHLAGDPAGGVRRLLPGVHPDHHRLRCAGRGGWRLSGAGAGGLQGGGRPAAVRPRRPDRHGPVGAGVAEFCGGCLAAPSSRRRHERQGPGVPARRVPSSRRCLSGIRIAGLRGVAAGVRHGGVLVPGQVLALQPVAVAQPLPVRGHRGGWLAGLPQQFDHGPGHGPDR